MRLKPLPYRAQKKGRKISAFVAVSLGLVFAGALGTFIGLTATSATDAIIESENEAAINLKDVGDGFVYATKDNHIVLSSYGNEVISNTDLKEALAPITSSVGTLISVTSLNYSNETNRIFMTCDFKSASGYEEWLFELAREESNKFALDTSANFTKVDNAITAFTERVERDMNGEVTEHYLYAAIRDGSYCTINRYDARNLASSPDTGYLYSKILNYDDPEDDEALTSFTYDKIVNGVVYDLHYANGHLYSVFNNGVIAIKDGCFSEFPDGLDEVPFDQTAPDALETYQKYLFYYYTHSSSNPHGAALIDGECYMITDSKQFAHFSYDELNMGYPADAEQPAVDETLINGVVFDESAPSNRSGFFYNPVCKRGVVISDLADIVTFVDMSDLKDIKILFVDASDINITDVVIGNNGDSIYYLCQNEQVTKNNDRMIKLKLASNVYSNIEKGKFTPALLVISIVGALLFVIALLCWIRPLFLEKFLLFLNNVKTNVFAYLILAVCLTLLGMFCYYPAVGSISMSFFRYKSNQPIVWNNFGNYATVFSDPQIWQSFGNMVLFLVADIITAIIPPLIFAFFLTVMKSKKVSAVTRTLLFLPSVIPGITKMMIWQNGIYGPHGFINGIIELFKGNPVIFFNGGNFDIWALILMGFPYVGSYLVFYGALMNIPSSYYEAAELEGLNVWKRFVSIDIPLIRPQIKYVAILTIIASVQNFGRTYMINSSAFTVRTPIHIMYDYINKGDYGLSSAIATILFLLLLVCTIFNMRKQKAQLGDSI